MKSWYAYLQGHWRWKHPPFLKGESYNKEQMKPWALGLLRNGLQVLENEAWGVLSKKILVFPDRSVVLSVEDVSFSSQSCLWTQHGADLALCDSHNVPARYSSWKRASHDHPVHTTWRRCSRMHLLFASLPSPTPIIPEVHVYWSASAPSLRMCKIKGLVASSPLWLIFSFINQRNTR